jgi:hypothetical protein
LRMIWHDEKCKFYKTFSKGISKRKPVSVNFFSKMLHLNYNRTKFAARLQKDFK